MFATLPSVVYSLEAISYVDFLFSHYIGVDQAVCGAANLHLMISFKSRQVWQRCNFWLILDSKSCCCTTHQPKPCFAELRAVRPVRQSIVWRLIPNQLVQPTAFVHMTACVDFWRVFLLLHLLCMPLGSTGVSLCWHSECCLVKVQQHHQAVNLHQNSWVDIIGRFTRTITGERLLLVLLWECYQLSHRSLCGKVGTKTCIIMLHHFISCILWLEVKTFRHSLEKPVVIALWQQASNKPPETVTLSHLEIWSQSHLGQCHGLRVRRMGPTAPC